MWHFKALKQVVVRSHESIEASEVIFARGRRGHSAAQTALQVFEYARLREGKLDFVPIQDLEYDAVMAVETQLFETERDFF